MMGRMTYNDLIVLIPSHSLEDFPSDLPEEKAEGLLNAFAVLWHPRLLASARVLPSWHRADDPPHFTRDRLIVVPSTAEDRLPSDWADRARADRAVLIVGVSNRAELLAAALAPLDSSPDTAAKQDNTSEVAPVTDEITTSTENDGVTEKPTKGAAHRTVADTGESSDSLENSITRTSAGTIAEPASRMASPPEPPQIDPELEAEFLALGTCHLQLELLTRHMHHFTSLDEAHLKREVVAAADAALANDIDAARTHLRNCFEVLLEARERFYPVDCYLIDLCLVIPRLADEHVENLLSREIPLNVTVTGADLAAIAEKRPAIIERLKEAWNKGTLDLVGGEYLERPSPLLPLSSVLWEFEYGHQVMRELLGRTPVTWGRRKFGLSTLMPHILNRLGYHEALHVVLDDGIYPDAEHSKVRWEGCDGTIVDAITRIPLAADSASSFLRFAARMAETMEQDQVAAVFFARWPELKSPWFGDLERIQRYVPVLGRFITLREFFQSTDDPGRMAKYEAGEYLSPFFIQAVAGEERDPISRFIDHTARRSAFDAASWCRRTARVLKGMPILSEQEADCERQLEEFGLNLPEFTQQDLSDAAAKSDSTVALSGTLSPTAERLQILLNDFSADAARDLSEVVMHGAGQQPGYLVFNTLSFPRTVTVELPSLETPPVITGPVRGLQFDEERRFVTLDLPGSGYAWIPLSSASSNSNGDAHATLALPNLLRNEFFEVYINEETGGIAEIKEYGRRPNRLSQQLAFRFPLERTITIVEGDERDEIRTYYSAMRCESSHITCAGPGMGEIVTSGEIYDQSDGSRLATFRQGVRVYRGRRDIEIDVELHIDRMPEGDPWSNFFASRFAWHDGTAALTRSLQQQAQPFTMERFESPYYLEIATDSERTTILNCGLPFHRKTGPRMVDTILVAAGETRRRFQLRVAFDVNYPMQAAMNALTEPVVVATKTGPPRTGSTGWFFHIDASNVQILRVMELVRDPSLFNEAPLSSGPEGPPASKGFALRVVETEGRYRSATLRCFRTPTRARQRDLQGRTVAELRIIDDGVPIELAGYEIADIELQFGES